jgi:glutamate mutase epsilon subunit
MLVVSLVFLRIDLNNVSHIITEMWMDGKNAFGKARIIENHPKGQIVKAILDAGGKLGVSSRGSGNVNEGKVSGFNLVTVDVVATPSAPNAFPGHVMESLNDNQKIMTLAEAVIHDKTAQKYFIKELSEFFEKLTGQQLKKD